MLRALPHIVCVHRVCTALFNVPYGKNVHDDTMSRALPHIVGVHRDLYLYLMYVEAYTLCMMIRAQPHIEYTHIDIYTHI